MAQHTIIENIHRNTEDWFSVKAAVRGKGVDCPDDTPTADVAEKIEEIETGGGGYSAEVVAQIFNGDLPDLFEFPTTIEMIKNEAFSVTTNPYNTPCGARELDIPNNIYNIGAYAFKGAHNLEKLTIRTKADQDLLIGLGAFDGYNENDQPQTTWLEILAIVGDGDNVTISGNAFRGHTQLHTIVFPKWTEVEYANAFDTCTGVTDIYYAGTETEFNQCKRFIRGFNWDNITVHYNYTGDGSEL